MNNIVKYFIQLIVVLPLCVQIAHAQTAQAKFVSYDLPFLAKTERVSIFNRTLTSFQEKPYKAVRLSEKEAEGIAYIKDVQFTTGVIELDIRGKDTPQKSFLGIAFHGADEKTYDAIYFRPFNFKSPDPDKNSHSVQYISHPEFTWQKLRAEHTGQYEKSINPVVDPNKWFHVRIQVSKELIQVFVENAKEPSLQVKPLNNRTSGSIGLWVGNGSGGEFANLKITAE